MWRRAEDNEPGQTPGPVMTSCPPKQPAPTGQESSGTPAVSKGIKIKGDIAGQGDLSIDGELEGNVRLSGGTFIVGPNARVKGEIEAREVIIRGEVIGALKACERVHIWGTGRLTGDMETRGIVIDDGAVLHSQVAVPKAEAHQVHEDRPHGAGETNQADQPVLQKTKASGA